MGLLSFLGNLGQNKSNSGGGFSGIGHPGGLIDRLHSGQGLLGKSSLNPFANADPRYDKNYPSRRGVMQELDDYLNSKDQAEQEHNDTVNSIGQTADSSLPPYARAFLDATASGESAGKYNIRYTARGGREFSGNAHPAIYEPGPAGPSSAAGRYQITKQTWDSINGGNEDFSPQRQDQAAWALAQRDYRSNTGRDLNVDLQAKGFDSDTANALAGTWASFKQGGHRESAVYKSALERYSATGSVSSLLGDDGAGKSPPVQGGADLVASAKRGSSPDLGHLRPEIVSGVEQLQQSWGKPLPIVSGFRDAARNAKAGGAKGSQHLHGNAVDIDVSGLSTDERNKLIETASAQGFTGIGVYPTSLHLDYGSRRAWGPNFSHTSVPSWAKQSIGDHLARSGDGPMAADVHNEALANSAEGDHSLFATLPDTGKLQLLRDLGRANYEAKAPSDPSATAETGSPPMETAEELLARRRKQRAWEPPVVKGPRKRV